MDCRAGACQMPPQSLDSDATHIFALSDSEASVPLMWSDSLDFGPALTTLRKLYCARDESPSHSGRSMAPCSTRTTSRSTPANTSPTPWRSPAKCTSRAATLPYKRACTAVPGEHLGATDRPVLCHRKTHHLQSEPDHIDGDGCALPWTDSRQNPASKGRLFAPSQQHSLP